MLAIFAVLGVLGLIAYAGWAMHLICILPLHEALSAFLGPSSFLASTIALFVVFLFEKWRTPLLIFEPNPGERDTRGPWLNARLCNDRLFSISRDPAMECRCSISYLNSDTGKELVIQNQGIWDGKPQPYIYRLIPDDHTTQVFWPRAIFDEHLATDSRRLSIGYGVEKTPILYKKEGDPDIYAANPEYIFSLHIDEDPFRYLQLPKLEKDIYGRECPIDEPWKHIKITVPQFQVRVQVKALNGKTQFWALYDVQNNGPNFEDVEIRLTRSYLDLDTA